MPDTADNPDARRANRAQARLGADVAVLGGGVIGLSIAWQLAVRGADVVVVDAGKGLPAGTWAAAGMLAPSFEGELDKASLKAVVYALGMESLGLWPEFARQLQAETGHSIDFRLDGILGAAFSEAEATALKAQGETAEAQAAGAIHLTRAETLALEPSLAHEVTAGLLMPGEGQVDPRLVVRALRTAIERRGGRLVDGQRAARVDEVGGQLAVLLDLTKPDGGHASASETIERVDAPFVVDARGASSDFFANHKGPPILVPFKGEALSLGVGALRGQTGQSPVWPSRVVRTAGVYLCPKQGGRLVVGATEVRGRDDMAPSGEAIAHLRLAAEKVCPKIHTCEERERWAGVRPGTIDGAPVIGPAPNGPSGLYLALGHYRNGVLQAPATADIVAKAILEGAASSFLEAFSPDRLAPDPELKASPSPAILGKY